MIHVTDPETKPLTRSWYVPCQPTVPWPVYLNFSKMSTKSNVTMLKSHIQSMIFILTLLLLLIYYLFYYYYSSDKVVENFYFYFDGQTLARFQFYCVVLNSREPNNCSVHKNCAQELQVLSRPMVLKQRTDILCIPESACRTIYLDYLPLIRLIKWNVL